MIEQEASSESVAHDLRDAINNMTSSAACLGRMAELSPEGRRFARAIERNGARARHLLEALCPPGRTPLRSDDDG